MIQLTTPIAHADAPRVLLALGDGASRRCLAADLTREGLRVAEAENEDEALARVAADRPHAVILVLGPSSAAGGPPHVDRLEGLALCRRLRGAGAGRGAALLVLGPRAPGELAELAAFESGADAYVTVPCSAVVLAARVRALCRPGPFGVGVQAISGIAESLRVAGWEVDPGTFEARGAGGRRVVLTRTEYRLLALLAANSGRTVPTALLQERAELAPLRQHLSRLRRKLGLPASGPGSLLARAGLGYRLAPV